MLRIQFKSQVLPHLIAIAVFLVITLVFFHPIFFGNKAIQQSDVLQGIGAGQEIKEYREATGEEPLWTNSMFGGMPAYLISVVYPGEGIVNTLQTIYSLWLPRTPGIIFKAMLSFYILLLVFGIRPYVAIAGAIAFGLGTFNMISLEAGHVWKVDAIAYMPLVLAGIHVALKGNRMWGFTLTALALAFEIDSNHLQVTYYLLLIVILYGVASLVHAIRVKQLQPLMLNVGILVLAALLAIGTTAGRLWNTFQYSQYSIRGASELSTDQPSDNEGGLNRDYAFAWSIGTWEAFTLLVPDFAGGASNRGLSPDSETADFLRSQNINRQQIQQFIDNAPTYWGKKPFTGGPTYAGAIVCFLFVIGCFFAPRGHRAWLIAATLLSILLAWGKNFPVFNNLMFDFFPGYNKFRVVEMAMIIALMCMPLLGFIGLEKLLQKGFDPVTQKRFWLASGITLGLLLTLIVFAGAGKYESAVDQQYISQGMTALVDTLREDREAMLRSDAFRSFLFIAAVIALLYFYLKRNLSFPILAAGFGILMLIDFWSIDRRYLNDEDYVRESNRLGFFNATEADQYILQDTTQYRVLNLQNTFNDGRTSYFHASIGGYHGAKMRRYQDLIDRYLSEEINRIIQQIQQGSRNFSNIPVLNMLNTKYIMAGSNQNAVLTNPGAFGNAWFVSQVNEVNSPDEEIEALANTNLQEAAIVDVSRFPLTQTSYNSGGSIRLTDYQPNHLTYEVEAAGESFAVFSEIYYADGWKALIDGQDADYVRANYILRALPIPAGTHTVEFVFDPTSYRVGSTSTVIFSILLLIALLGSMVYTGKDLSRKEAV